jgi:hypothetical protein
MRTPFPLLPLFALIISIVAVVRAFTASNESLTSGSCRIAPCHKHGGRDKYCVYRTDHGGDERELMWSTSIEKSMKAFARCPTEITRSMMNCNFPDTDGVCPE